MDLILLLLGLMLGLPIGTPVLDGNGSGEVTIILDPASSGQRLSLPVVSGPQGLNRPLVVIDPGHGGRDPGAISPLAGEREKDVTLAIARAIRDALVASGRVRVALTRDDDRFLILRDRYEIARQLKAELFISVHADAAPNPMATGATIYTLSEVASDQEAALLAKRENEADLAGGTFGDSRTVDVSRILIDLAQRESMDISARFASILHREASPSVPFRPVYHRFASLVVLKAPDIPSVLFEAGYLTHAPDLAYIQSAKGRQEIADGMRRAIEAHFARRIAGSAGRIDRTG